MALFESSTRLGFSESELERITRRQGHIGVGNPGHFPRTRSEVWGGHVNAWTDEILLQEFKGVTAGYAFELRFGVFMTGNLDSTFRSSERNIHESTLIGHQSRKSFDLVLVHHEAVPYAAFGRKFVL